MIFTSKLTLMAVVSVALMSMAQEAPSGFGASAQYRLGIGARAFSMGGAYTAVAEGPVAPYWNPAGLAFIPLTAGGMYTEPFSGGGGELGYRVQYIGVAGSQEGYGFGAGWFNVHISDIPYTEEGGTFDYNGSVFLGSVATTWEIEGVGKLAVGGTVKLYRESMLAGRAQGLGWDAGLLLIGDGWRLGYCSQDIAETKYHWKGTGQEPLVVAPWVHRMGAAYGWEDVGLLVAAEVLVGASVPPEFGLGLEWEPLEGLAFRGGLRLRRPIADLPLVPTWSAGAGLKWEMFVFDFAFLRSVFLPGEEGLEAIYYDTYVFSLGLVF